MSPVVRPAAGGLARALLLSLAAAAIPISGAFLFPDTLQDYEALAWLTLLVPAFLWAYERGWGGVATALALGMAALSATYAVTEVRGGEMPDLLLPVIVVYITTSLAIGLFGDRLVRAQSDAAAETLALQDPLTGLPNRRHAELHAAMEFAAAERGRLLTVVLFDVDYLKRYNAEHGRAAGDGVLRGFATLLRQHTRRMDLAARYGADEFLSVLGGCTTEGAVIFAARLQERLRAAEHMVSLPTVSAGIATYRPDMTTPAELLQAAEEALEQAKQDGGDRVRVHGRPLSDVQVFQADDPDRSVLEHADESATAMLESVRKQLTLDGLAKVGRGRTAFVLTADVRVRERLLRFLRDEGFHVTEGSALPDTFVSLQAEFDLVFVDVAPDAGAVVGLIREIRQRSPLTRVIGIPRGGAGGLPPDILRVRVDGHYVATADDMTLRSQLRELLLERDVRLHVQLQHSQLSREMETKDRESRQALAASEAKYRSVLQSIQEVIFTTDVEGAWTFLNGAWSTITGFDVAASLGRSLFEFLHEDDVADLRARFEQLIGTRTPYFRHECRWRTRGGEHRWVELRLQPVIGPAGGVEGTSGVLADVSDRRLAEAAVRESEELRVRAQKMEAIGRLAGGVAHDFNNLLTAIQGHADLLLSDIGEPSAVRANVSEIREAASRATVLTRQLLAFSRRQVMQPRVIDLNDVVRNVQVMVRSTLGEQVTLVTRPATDAGHVRADPDQVEQVLVDLLMNARDAMPDGGTVTVSTAPYVLAPGEPLTSELEPGRYVLLTVSDEGSGMTQATAAHAFEPFFTTKEIGRGTGLGLSTVYGTVKQSGGHAWLTSSVETGTVVHVLLPHVDEAEDAAPHRPPRGSSSTSTQAAAPVERGSATILLVEDEKSVRELTLRILRRHGYDLLVAANGVEALALLRAENRHIDLLLTDVVMPAMNGQDLAEAVRALRPDIRVIFMSGYNEEAVLREGVLADGTAFIEKPFSPAALLAIIHDVLGAAPVN